MTDQAAAPGYSIPATAPLVATTPVTPNGLPLSSVGKRFGGYILDGVLIVVTLGIGWLIWACISMSRGQTPAKQVLKMRVVKPDTGRAASWGGMFVRDVVFRGLVVSVLGMLTLGILPVVAALMILGGTMRQTMWDRMAGTVVVDDPEGVALR